MRTLLKSLLRRARTALSPSLDYKSAWNRWAVADAHDAILTGASPEEFERTGQSDAALLGRYLRGGEVVLNIGCGVGRIDKYLGPRVRELHAIDVSGDMIQRARVRLAGLPNVHLREVGNKEFLSAFEAGRFDLVFSFLVLQHLEKEDAFLYLRDAARVLKPDGWLVTQFPNFLFPAYTRGFVDSAGAQPRGPDRVRAYTEPEVRHLLATAGFTVADLWYGGHQDQPAEIYVTARRAPS